MRALAVGALDLLSKPDLEALRLDAKPLIDRLRLLSRVPVISHPGGRRGRVRGEVTPARRASTGYFKRASRVVAIAASTGGPRALTVLLGGLPAGLKAAVVIVQHIEASFEEGLARWLDDHCPLEVTVAKDQMELLEGRVYLAPQGRFSEVTTARRIALVDDPTHTGMHCPSGDRLLESAATAYGPRAIGVVLTGMGRDGADGLLAIRQGGGTTIAQDEASSVVYGMPQAAAQNGAAQQVLPLDRVAAAIVEALA
jgi:two-component system chemotaxis response regulator CheB